MSTKHKLLHEELSYQVLGCAFETFKAVGVGFDELTYHNVFHQFLIDQGLDAKYKTSLNLEYLGKKVGRLEIDEIVENKIIVELKAIQSDFLPRNFAQIMTYLKTTKLRLGLLVNFGLTQACHKRIIFDEHRIENTESWDDGFLQSKPIQSYTESLISSIREIDCGLGVALHRKVYQRAMKLELKRKGLTCDGRVVIKTAVKGVEIGPFEIDYWLIENRLLLGILAGKNQAKAYDLLRMRSYLRKLNLHYGLIAYWSTKNLQLFGIYEA